MGALMRRGTQYASNSYGINAAARDLRERNVGWDLYYVRPEGPNPNFWSIQCIDEPEEGRAQMHCDVQAAYGAQRMAAQGVFSAMMALELTSDDDIHWHTIGAV